MSNTPSACRHDTSERSTLTLTIPLSLKSSRLCSMTCSVCGRRVGFEPEALDSSWQWPLQILGASSLFQYAPAQRMTLDAPEGSSSSSATASNSSSPVPTPQASATSGKADSPTASPSSVPTSYMPLSDILRSASARPRDWRLTWLGEHGRGVKMDNLRELTNRLLLHGGRARLTHFENGLNVEATLEEMEHAGRR